MRCSCGVKLLGNYAITGNCRVCTIKQSRLEGQHMCKSCKGVLTPILVKYYTAINAINMLESMECINCMVNGNKGEYNKMHNTYTRMYNSACK